MHFFLASLHFTLLIAVVTSQQIWDIWQTNFDQTKLMTRWPVSNGLPLQFNNSGTTAQANINIQDDEILQNMDGFGATLTDSSAKLLDQLKNQNSGNYWTLLNELFNPAYGVAGAGLTALRLPVGSSDFSGNVYSWDDVWADTSLKSFSTKGVPSYVWTTLKDIKSISSEVKIFAVAWSPPSWMKTTNTMLGGSINPNNVSIMANYLLKAVQTLHNQGFTPYAIGIQNEPQNSNPTYPTALVSAQIEAEIGLQLRSLLNNNSFSGVKIVGYEHNWNDAGGYPIQLMQQASSAFAGVSFHCYEGSVRNQSLFHSAYPNKEIYLTECTGSLHTDWWSNIKWYMDNLFIGGPENWARTVMMWNLALDGNGNPLLPGTNSCGEGCQGVVTISGGSYSVNEEYYVMAQTSRAVIPADPTGPHGQRMGVVVEGSLNSTLRVGAYKTGRSSSSAPDRFSIVVLNWNDNKNGKWDPQSVEATIEFRGRQATFTFQVGITTLWWFDQ